MYFTQLTLLSMLCVISEQTIIFNKNSQGITDITVHTIPGGTTNVLFYNNAISYIPPNYFKNLLSLDGITF